jgi:hypothetical protein
VRTTVTTEAIDHDRRRLPETAATGIAAAGVASMLRANPAAAAEGDAIRPFRVNVPEEALVDLRRFFDVSGVTMPVAVSAFPDEIYAAPRSWAERAYPKLVDYDRLDMGGRFAAWEQPQLFSGEMRAAFKSLRQAT